MNFRSTLFNGLLTSVGMLITIGLMAQTASLQVVHNSADLAASTVDVRVNGDFPDESYDDLEFRSATPFLDVPAGVDLEVTINPSTSVDDSEALYTETFNLADGETYQVVASGIVSELGYDPAPDFSLEVFAGAREASSMMGNTDVLVNHGSTDAPTVDVREPFLNTTLVDDISYPEFQGYLELGTANYTVEVTTADGSTVVQTYAAPLEDLGLEGAAVTVFASGFLDPSANSDGPAFGLFASTPSGGELVALPTVAAGDEPCTAMELSTDGSTMMVNNESATTAADEVIPEGTENCGSDNQSWCSFGDEPVLNNTLWFTFTAPESGSVMVNTCSENNTVDTQLAVYEAGDCNDFSTFSLVSANDDAPFCGSGGSNFASTTTACGLTAGETYYVQVDGYEGASGDIEISAMATECTARAQIIHNAADLAAATVDVRVNGEFPDESYDDLEFRTATPFLDVPANVDLNVTVNGPDSQDDSEALFSTNVNFIPGATYIIVARGIVSESGYDPGADEAPFGLSVRAPAAEASPDETIYTLVQHGVTDAPAVDVLTPAVPDPLVDGLEYPNFDGYLAIPEDNYQLDVTTDDQSTTVASFIAPLADLELSGTALTVCASGFLDPSANSDGPAFGLWVALPSGGPLVELSNVTGVDEVRSLDQLSVFPNPATTQIQVNYSLNTNAELSMDLYSVTGKLVRSQDLGTQPAGGNIVRMDISDVESGMYMLRMNIDGEQLVKRVQVVR